MSKLSMKIVEKNSERWTKNLVRFDKSLKMRRKTVEIWPQPLSELSRMPQNEIILGRYFALAKQYKAKHLRYKKLEAELRLLWTKMSFPMQSSRTIMRKVKAVVSKYDNVLKHQSGQQNAFKDLFDITDVKKEWLTKEDKQFYFLQIESGGSKGYTSREASLTTIHPSKRRRKSPESSSEATTNIHDTIDTALASEDEGSLSSGDSDPSWHPSTSEINEVSKSRPSKTSGAVEMVRACNVSITSAANIGNLLTTMGLDVPAPSKSGIHKAVYREAELVIESIKSMVKSQTWALHFDGKIIDKKERQVVVLTNASNEVRLDILTLPNGQSKTIADGISTVLTEYDVWEKVAMIICDTCSVNTGAKSGVVVRLQSQMPEGRRAQYVGCQHHILDGMFKKVLDQLFGNESRSPNIEYDFVKKISESYENLKERFDQEEHPYSNVTPRGYRDDQKFLWNLINAYHYWEENGVVPKIGWKTLPSLCKARWNSRGIFALIAFLMNPQEGSNLHLACKYLSGAWGQAWFSDQTYDENIYDQLLEESEPYEKAAEALARHWSRDESAIRGISRTNVAAERAIKAAQDTYDRTRTLKTFRQRFLMTNRLR